MNLIKNITLFLVMITVLCCSREKKEQMEQPNILWITCEDISPYLGSYGCKEAQTPHLDELANTGIRYTRAYANAPVCAVARSTILTGMYATTIGTHQMRSDVRLPDNIPAYPKILGGAGYYCTNNSKKDYNSNFEYDTTLWDESSNTAHYENRKEGQPFFAVFNIGVTHESRLSENFINGFIDEGQIPEKPRINPDDIELPPYHPDLPEIRQDWARLHDLITFMDSRVGELLDELEQNGLADNTIVFFYSDHGGQLARSKRFIYNVGTQIPLIIRLPDKWSHLSKIKPGGTDNSLVSFVDFAKTALSISGCEIPGNMQGRIFLGKEKQTAPGYVHFFRDRMAERYDFCRAVTNGEYYFIRNFTPHRPRGRSERYGYTVQANWRAWEDHFEAGKCDEIQSQFYRPRAVAELFNTREDPWHIENLEQNSHYREMAEELSDELDQWMIETRDIGLIPEPMFADLAGEGKKYRTIHEYAQSSEYPVRRILEVAKLSSSPRSESFQDCLLYMGDQNPVIRYWAAYGMFLEGSANASIQQALQEMMRKDEFAANRIMAAQALGLCGNADQAFKHLMKECNEAKNGYILLQAINALQYARLDDRITRDAWLAFKDIEFTGAEDIDKYGVSYGRRIINDAIETWPDRKPVY